MTIGSMLLAFVAGLITLLNPCVLPLIPILIGAALKEDRFGPLALAAGLVLSFSLFGLFFLAFGFSLGINEQVVRLVAGGLLALAGVVMLVPRLQARLSAAGGGLSSRGHHYLANVRMGGNAGQFVIGLLLGLVWAPCVGPTLGVAIAAASQSQNLLSAFATFLIFGSGVATSILLFAYGSRKALGERRERFRQAARFARPLFGGAVLAVGVMVMTGLDKFAEAALLGVLPQGLIEFTTRF